MSALCNNSYPEPKNSVNTEWNKEFQEKTDNNSRFLKTIIDNIPGGVVKIILQKDKIVPVFISDSWCSMMGDTRETVIEMYKDNAMAGVHPDDYDRVWNVFITAMQTGQPIDSVYRIGNSKGEYRWVNNRSSLVSESNGVVAYYAVYTDVTEEMNAKEQKKRVEEKLMAAMQHTNIMFWEYYFENDLCVNGFKSIRELGMPELMPNYPECIISNGFVHSDSAEAFRLMHKKLKSGVPSAQLDIKVVNSDGHIEWKRIKYTAIYDESGIPVSALGTSEDITEQVLLSKKYKDAIEHYHNNNGDHFVITGHCNITKNEILEIVSANGKDYVAIYGKKRDTFFKGFSTLVVGEEKKREFINTFLNIPLTQGYENGVTTQKMECLIRREDGCLKYAAITVDVMKQPDTGELTGFFSVADITNEIVYKKAINSLVDHYYDFMVDVDIKSDTYTILSKKRGLASDSPTSGIFSQIKKESAQIFADEKTTQESIQKLSFDYMVDRLNKEDSYSFNYEINKNGQTYTKKLQVFYIDKVTGHIGISQEDITDILNIEQQKNEALTHALTSAERASNAKTEFLSRMSHDIRTPMNAIIGMTALTMQELDDKAKVMDNLAVIDSSGKLLLSIINDLLDMSKIESGNLTLVRETFDCEVECQNIIEMAKVTFEQKHQIFKAEKNLIHRCFVGDIIRLKRVIFNLLNNASKFTSNGGTIKLRVNEEQTANSKISMLIFEVCDSGIGIPQDKINSIFEPFTQLDSQAMHQGTGLGLSIVKSIVEAKGGTITVKSEVGKGSVFTVAFPMEVAEKKMQAINVNDDCGAAKSGVDLGYLKVLLVEDHPVNTMVAKRLLEKCGATVDTAENGEIAYDKFKYSKTNQYNLIFMDIQMPVMNGYECAKAIRACDHHQAKTIPIIAMTANAYAEDIKKATDSGMNGHIAKPINMDLVVREIQSATKEVMQKKEKQNDRK